MKTRERIEYLIEHLNQASDAYYNGGEEIMSNYEWDQMFDELTELENTSGIIMENSPTQNAGYETNSGNREEHEFPALSLAKTKSVEELVKWSDGRLVWISWKLDGLTLVLTYDNGQLQKIVTRGSGVAGKNITHLKQSIKGIPLKIKEKGHLVVRGEAAISYTDFNQINDMIEDEDEKYANPRNLASGTLNLDDVAEVKNRKVCFYAFTLVYAQKEINSWGEQIDFLKEMGFCVVEKEKANPDEIPSIIDKWTQKVENGEMDIPVDGLVICYDDTNYAATGNVTGHHATRAGLAFKWQDESAKTLLKYIEWSCAVSTISPVAVFEPIQLEGTTVSRASLCNLSEIERLGIGATCTLEIIKANKIIPKCIGVENAKGDVVIPETCPVCHAKTQIRISEKSKTKTLHCTNENCTAKHVKKFTRFVSKQGMDIDGLSIQTMLRFINEGFIKEFADLYSLQRYYERICKMDGFGEKSCKNMIQAIENRKKVHPVSLIYALCIPMIGIDAAKKIVNTIGFEAFIKRLEQQEGFEDIEGIGIEKSTSILDWYRIEENRQTLQNLLQVITVEKIEKQNRNDGNCSGLTFVITGDVKHYKNRDEFKHYVESQGGKVTGSVSQKTSFLVNNDIESASSKNKKAKELNIPIITEEEFINRFVN